MAYNEDEELPAPVKTTNVNSSQLRTPPYHVGPLPPPPPPPPPFPSSSCAKPLRGTRLIAIHRWLSAAHHVEKEALSGEDMDCDCLKTLERGETVAPSHGRCWGDAGNGVHSGWWVWGQALMRRELGLL